MFEKLKADIKAAMRNKDQDRLTVLRGLHSAVKDLAIKAGDREFITDDIFRDALSKSIKQRKEAIELYAAHGHEDMVAKERAELLVLESFQPAQLSEDEIAAIVDREIAACKSAGESVDVGKIMAKVMPDVKGKADGKIVNQVVRSRLT